MTRKFSLPDVGEGITEAEVVHWMVEEGDDVAKDEPLMEVETDKAIIEIPAPFSGEVVERVVEQGDVVEVGEVIVRYDGEEEAPGGSESGDDHRVSVDREYTADPGMASPSTRRLAQEAGVDVDEVEGSGGGGRVTEADVVEAAGLAPDEGRRGRPEGERAPGGLPRDHGGDADTTDTSGVGRLDTPARADGDEVVASGAEAEKDVRDPIQGGPREGGVHEGEPDVDAPGGPRGLTGSLHPSAGGFGRPLAAHHDRVDVTELEELVTELEGVGYAPFVVKAVGAALKRHPGLNSAVDDDVVVHTDVDLRCVVESRTSTSSAVVRDADVKGVARLAHELDGGDDVEEPHDGGDDRFAVVHRPDHGGFATASYTQMGAGTLSFGRVEVEALVVDGEVEARPVAPLSLTYDVRAADAVEAASFIEDVENFVSRPSLLLLER